MARRVNLIVDDRDSDAVQDRLCDLEWAAYRTTLELRKIIALDPKRRTYLPFDPGSTLVSVVSPFSPSFWEEERKAIMTGAELAEKCAASALLLRELSKLELGYRRWATSRLLRHLLHEL